MTTSLSKEKVQAISQLYTSSESFRKNVDSAILNEANLASNLAKLLSAAVDPGQVDPSTVKPPGKKLGPKPGSKRKASKKTTKKTGETTTETRVTHRDAILKVLVSSGSKMTKKEIETGLQAITGHDAPSSQTLLTTLHGMKKDGLILGSGERPNLQYSVAK